MDVGFPLASRRVPSNTHMGVSLFEGIILGGVVLKGNQKEDIHFILWVVP